MDYNRLDQIVRMICSEGGEPEEQVGELSTGERMYVAIASSRPSLLGKEPLPYVLSRLGTEAVEEIMRRHRDTLTFPKEEYRP